MDTALTINVNQYVVENAEIYAKHNKKTVSQLVEEYLLSIPIKNQTPNINLGPITSQLVGIIELKDKIDYKELLTDALMEKYL